jgi:pantetheine-phosphate adenylyltransferase
MFPLDERVSLVEHEARALMAGNRVNGCRLEVFPFDNLLVDFARSVGAVVIIRGLRAVSDFEYEFQMALMNRKLKATVETVFLMPHEKYTYISSRLIKEVASFGTSVAGMVPPIVEKRLAEKYPLK